MEKITSKLKGAIGYLSKPIKLPMFLFLVFVFLLGFASVLYYKAGSTMLLSEKIKNKLVENESEKVLSEVGKITSVPDEIPTIMTVSDPTKLKDGPSADFFKNAKEGDKFLLFSKSGKAILYRPSEKKILEIVTLQPTTQ